MGPDVAVLDHLKFTFDAREIAMSEEEKKKKEAEDKMAADKAMKDEEEKKAKDAKDAEEKEIKEKAEKEAADKAAKDAAEEEEEEKKKKDGMDAAEIKTLRARVESLEKNALKTVLGEIAKRDDLASRLSGFIGTFDHAEKTLAEVASYGAEKLGLKGIPAGQEIYALEGYMHGRKAPALGEGVGMDGGLVKKSTEIDEYLSGTKH